MDFSFQLRHFSFQFIRKLNVEAKVRQRKKQNMNIKNNKYA